MFAAPPHILCPKSNLFLHCFEFDLQWCTWFAASVICLDLVMYGFWGMSLSSEFMPLPVTYFILGQCTISFCFGSNLQSCPFRKWSKPKFQVPLSSTTAQRLTLPWRRLSLWLNLLPQLTRVQIQLTLPWRRCRQDLLSSLTGYRDWKCRSKP